jgi:rRNA-processing protein FCF1
MRIILDTNALMAIAEFKLDVFAELKSNYPNDIPVVLSGVIEELEKIQTEQRGKFKLAAKLGLQILKAKKIRIVESEGNVDDALVEHSKKGNLVLTQDIALKRRLNKPYMTIRQKKKIILVN